jgi:hypothetical protein
MTSARPEDKDKPVRLAFREFRRLLVTKSVKSAIQYLEGLEGGLGKAVVKKHAAEIRRDVGFYGNIFIDASDFNCDDLHRQVSRSKKTFKFVVRAGKCGACIHRHSGRCANFHSSLVDSRDGIKIDESEAAHIVHSSTRDPEILEAAKTDPVFALQLTLIRES